MVIDINLDFNQIKFITMITGHNFYVIELTKRFSISYIITVMSKRDKNPRPKVCLLTTGKLSRLNLTIQPASGALGILVVFLLIGPGVRLNHNNCN